MKFKGHGIVWDAEKNCILCRFKDGEFETEDRDLADRLKYAGYDSEGEIQEAKTLEEKTVKELKALFDEKGIEYDAKAKKEDLIKLLEGAE